jgi:hypothetical protein
MDEVAFKNALAESRNGANYFVRHWYRRNFQYSDGVEELGKAGWMWLIDILATEAADALRKSGDTPGIVHIVAKDGRADIDLTIDDDKPPIWTRHIDWTDTPDGEYDLYLADEGDRFALILMTEN